jgi:anti-anti-sigma factor
MLSVTIESAGVVAVLRCVGRIVVGDEADTLREAVLSQADRRTVILDLARVDAIDGSGIGLLVFLHAWARAGGIELKLMSPTRQVRELLELTNLSSVFEISSSENPVLSHPLADPAAAAAVYQSPE